MENTIFVRVDEVGGWHGTEHQSRCGVPDEEWFDCEVVDGEMVAFKERTYSAYENGISCYRLEEGNGLVKLVEYLTSMYWGWEQKQLTIFHGELLDHEGSDGEDLATCTATIKQVKAADILNQVEELMDDLECEDITEEEYESKLKALAAQLIKEEN
ncbi:hypothetical protein ACE106_15425 [Shouchella clausii]|uniref:hypothetical protein n=1 Tax=Shouchella clausii TaxID=79880 RepID=UPI002897C59B|nr:hypothetical protein [Shouchella clausii]